VHLSGGGQTTSQKVKALSALGFGFDGLLQAVDSYGLLLCSAYAQHRALNHVVHPSCMKERTQMTMHITLLLRYFLPLPAISRTVVMLSTWRYMMNEQTKLNRLSQVWP